MKMMRQHNKIYLLKLYMIVEIKNSTHQNLHFARVVARLEMVLSILILKTTLARFYMNPAQAPPSRSLQALSATFAATRARAVVVHLCAEFPIKRTFWTNNIGGTLPPNFVGTQKADFFTFTR